MPGGAVGRRIWVGLKAGAAVSYFWAGGVYYAWWRLPRLQRRHASVSSHAMRRLSQDDVRRGWRAYLRAVQRMGLLTLEVTGEVPLPEGPAVVVANHPTILDVVILTAELGPMCVVANQRYYQSPMVGRLLSLCGHIDGGDGGIEAGVRMMAEAAARLAQGERVLVFPEGTRSPPGSLLPISRAAFDIAARAGVPLVPICLECDPPVMTKGVPWYRVRPFCYRLSRLPSERVAEGRGAARAARARFEGALRSRLGVARVAGDTPESATSAAGADGGLLTGEPRT